MDTLIPNPDRLEVPKTYNNNLFESALITDIPFISKVRAFESPDTRFNRTYDPNFSITGNEADKLFEEYGATNIADRYTRFDAKNLDQLRLQLETYKTYQEADKQLGEAGFIPASLAHLGAGAVDVGGALVAGAAFGITSKAIGAFSTLESGALATLGNTLTSGIAAASAVGVTEYATEKAAYNYNSDRFKEVIAGGAILGGALGGITEALTHVRTPNSAKTILDGLDAAGNPQINDVEFTSPLGKLQFGVHEQLIKNDSAYAKEALNITNTTMAVKDPITGELIIQKNTTGMDTKEEALGAYRNYQNESEKLQKQMMPEGSIDSFVTKQGQEITIYNNKGYQEAGKLYVQEMKSLEDKINLYKQETGQEILPNEAKVVKVEQEIAGTSKVKEQTLLEHNKKLEDLQNNKDTVLATKRQQITDEAMKPLYEARDKQVSKLETTLTSNEENINKLTARKGELQNQYDTLDALSEDSFKSQKEFNINISKVDKILTEMSALDSKIAKLTEANKKLLTDIETTKNTTPFVSDKIKTSIETKMSKELKIYERQISELKSNQVTKEIDKQLAELNKTLEKDKKDVTIPDDLEQVIIQHYLKRVSGSIPVPEIVKPLKNMYKYFSDKMTEMKLHGGAGKISDFYHHRMWDREAFDNMPFETIKNKLVTGMENDTITKHYLSTGEVSRQDLLDTAESMIRDIRANSLMKEYTEVGFTNKASSGSPLKQRVIKINTDYVMDLLVHDANLIAERYSDKMAGRLALKQVGIDVGQGARSLSEAVEKKINLINKEAEANGATREQIIDGSDNLRVAYDILLGTRRIVNSPDALGHKIASTARLLSSAAYGGGFVKSAINELGAVVMRSSLLALKQFVPAHDIILRKLRGGDTRLADELISVNVGSQILEGARMTRYEIDELKNTRTWLERKLIMLNRKQRQISGFNHVTATTDNMAALAFFDELSRISKSGVLTKSEKERFSRLKLSKQDVLDFKDKAEITYAPNSDRIIAINWDNWADQGYANLIKSSVNRHVRDTVLRGDTLHMPKMASDVNSDIGSLFWQFKHYPLEATNRFLISGMTENLANTMSGAIVSMGIAASMTKLTNEALYQLGAVDKRIEDTELFKQAFDKSSISGVLPNIISLGQTLTGTEQYRQTDITKDFFGAGGSILTTANSIRDKIAHGESLTSKEYEKIFGITPFSHLPLLNEITRGLIKQNL